MEWSRKLHGETRDLTVDSYSILNGGLEPRDLSSSESSGAMEESSFPDTSSPPSSVSSPSTTHKSSSSYSSSSSSIKVLRIHRRSRSFSSLEDLKLGEREGFTGIDEEDEEERMDMLWEDFNEELGQIAGDGGKKILDFALDSSKLERKLFFVKAVRYRQPRLAMVVKVLKKLFFIQKRREKIAAASAYDGFR